MEENKDKRVLRVELNEDVKKVSITGMNASEKVVMRQELNETDLEQVTGGGRELYVWESESTPSPSHDPLTYGPVNPGQYGPVSPTQPSFNTPNIDISIPEEQVIVSSFSHH